MVLKVYGMLMSTCTTRVLICLKEKEIEYELVHVDLFSGEHKQPPFLSKNPFGQIPALEDGDLTLFESRGITSYVCEKYKEEGSDDLLRQGNLQEAALVKQWVEVESHQYNPPISQIVYQIFINPFMGKPIDQNVVNTQVAQLTNVLDVYEGRLSNTKYLAGDFYSLADLHCIPYTYCLMKSDDYSKLFNERPHVKAWWEDISSRPAFLEVAGNLKWGDKDLLPSV